MAATIESGSPPSKALESIGPEPLPTDQERALAAYVKLVRAAEAVTQGAHEHLEDAGLAVGEFAVLEALWNLGPLQPGEISAKLLCSGANVTLLVDKLSGKGLVQRQRDRGDRRRIHVHLTEEGRRKIADLFPIHARKLAEQFAVLSTVEVETLAELLRKLGKSTKPDPNGDADPSKDPADP